MTNRCSVDIIQKTNKYSDCEEDIFMKRSKVYNNRIMLIVLVAAILFFTVINCITVAYADEVVEYEKSFISIEIAKGDTLTSIAETYAKSEAEYQDYIEEVISINNLKNDTIHSGCYLLVPVYTIIPTN